MMAMYTLWDGMYLPMCLRMCTLHDVRALCYALLHDVRALCYALLSIYVPT